MSLVHAIALLRRTDSACLNSKSNPRICFKFLVHKAETPLVFSHLSDFELIIYNGRISDFAVTSQSMQGYLLLYAISSLDNFFILKSILTFSR